jgi:predicted esterase
MRKTLTHGVALAAIGFLVAALGMRAPQTDGFLPLDFPVPDFNHGGIRASFVVSLPAAYDESKSWPVILDFHGAIAPRRKGAHLARRAVWSKFVEKVPCLVVGLNGRTRAWGMVEGDRNDRAYAVRVLSAVRERFSIDPQRVYLAGFSSGSDFLCSGGLQLTGKFAGSLVVCPGPPNVVGLADGSLLEAKAWPFYFATGEEDYIRKEGAWKAFLALDRAGGRTMYREVPRKGHEPLGDEEYPRLFDYLETLAQPGRAVEQLKVAGAALERGDYLLASTHLLELDTKEARERLAEIEAVGKRLCNEARSVDAVTEPGRAYEAWWKLRTQFHRFGSLAGPAQKELENIEKRISGRELYRARRDWFRRRLRAAAKQGGEG